jgi:hypothetical protein
MKLNPVLLISLGIAAIGGGIGLFAAFSTEPMVGVFMVPFLFFMFFMVYRSFIKTSFNLSRLLKKGIRGTSTVLSVAETGTLINRQPLCRIEMQIEIPGQPAYNATTKRVISYFQVSQFQPGTQLHVMVDPANNQKVEIMNASDAKNENNPLANASPQQMDELKEKLAEMQKENDRIKAVGTYSKAIVTKFTNMGVNVNGLNPLATIEIQVMPDNEPAFGATVKGVIKQTSIQLYQPGEEIFVKYDPYDKSKVAIEHS